MNTKLSKGSIVRYLLVITILSLSACSDMWERDSDDETTPGSGSMSDESDSFSSGGGGNGGGGY